MDAWLHAYDHAELLPCPMCGADSQVNVAVGVNASHVWVSCTGCGVKTLEIPTLDDSPDSIDAAAAIQSWNARV